MTKFTFGGDEVEVGPENEKQFDAAGWSRVEEPKPSKHPDKDADKPE